MRWFRTNARGCGWFALFALALQLSLSFGHVHADDFGRPHPDAIIGTTGAPPAPGSDPPSRHDHDYYYCAICAVIALAGALLLPAPPAVAVAYAPPERPPTVWVALLVPGDQPLQVRARSPPV
jgi:hypothetical protein